MLSDTMMLGGGRKAAYTIENSLLFRGGQYLSREVAAGGSQQKWTWSGWVKRSSPGSGYQYLFCGANGGNDTKLYFTPGDQLGFHWNGAPVATSAAAFRDCSAWMHIVCAVDSVAPTAAARLRLWVNGMEITAWSLDGRSGISGGGGVNVPGGILSIGNQYYGSWGSEYFSGYMAEAAFVDGSTLAASSFGEVDSVTGSWRPKKLTGITWGPNGFHLKFKGLAPGGTRSAAQKFGGTMNGIAKGTYTNGTGIYNISTLNSGGYKTSGRWYMGHATSQRWLVWAKQGDGIHGNYGTTAASVLVGHSPLRYHYIKIAGVDFEQVNDSAGNWPVDSGTYYWTVLDLDAGRVEFYNPSGIYLFERAVAGWTPGAAYSTATCSFDSISVYFNLQDEPPRPLQGPGTGWDSIVDASGRGNTVTANGFTTTDVVKDTPTNVYCTVSKLANYHYYSSDPVTVTDGGLTVTHYDTGDNNICYTGTNFAASSGKFYLEMTCGATGTYMGYPRIGMNSDGYPTYSSLTWVDLLQSQGAGVTSCLAIDFDTGKYWRTFGQPVNVTQAPTGTISVGRLWWLCVLTHEYSPSTVSATFNFGQRAYVYAPPAGFNALCSANLAATAGQASGTFPGNGSTDGPCVYTGAVPLTLTVNGNAVTWGVHADKLATGFKIRTASASYNGSGSNNWTATYDRKPTVGPKGRAPANAQTN